MAVGHGYPRPQLVREEWYPLNGPWSFAIDEDAHLRLPADVKWSATIQVPFAPETQASGINNMGYYSCVWYRRLVDAPALSHGDRLLLHFGAVDHHATVWVNGTYVGEHSGGYTPFTLDITDVLRSDRPQEIVVRAYDDPTDLTVPRGKQDWQLKPHSIWYPRTTGIWQTVWMERVPSTFIGALKWVPSPVQWELDLSVALAGERRTDLTLNVIISVDGDVIAKDRYAMVGREVRRRILLSDPGIDDYRNELLWTPSRPRLIDAFLELHDAKGHVIDRVSSYTALRSFTVSGDRLLLNGRPYPLKLVLDQGYWPHTGTTPPDDASIKKDVELVRAMGFNGVRKHQKIEDPRFLFWADVMGLLVWNEMPSAYRYTMSSIEAVTKEWQEVLERDASHPCVIVWVPFNESWGVPNLPDVEAERHYVQAIYHLTKALDPTRPVISNDGWESLATDIIGIHDYDDKPERIAHRYHADTMLPRLLKKERPGGRELFIGPAPVADHPLVLTEFGGIALTKERDTWGYSHAATPEELRQRFEELIRVVRNLGPFSGYCYTQFSDTYQEANGLLYADRTPKFSLEAMAAANRGPR